MRLIAVTGGIGSGKSVVCEMLRVLGFKVYDCDSEARRLMDSDEGMRSCIYKEVCQEACASDGTIDRKALAAAVFADHSKLERLNSIVHGAVRDDLFAKAVEVQVMFFESAILRSSGFDAFADKVWEVTAPMQLRIERVMLRNGMSESEVKSRIESQIGESLVSRTDTKVIVNDGQSPLIPQVIALLGELL